MVFPYKKELTAELTKVLDLSSEITNVRSIGGGCINSAFAFDYGNSGFFLKENNRDEFPQMFKKESRGLQTLSQCSSLVIPKPIFEMTAGEKQLLVMEYLEKAPSSGSYSEKLGAGLAELHKIKKDFFGFDEDNYIGSLPQSNKKKNKWEDFFPEERLDPLVKWTYDTKMLDKKYVSSFENLYKRIGEIFPEEAPSVLHGDLWGGNAMNTTKGPAVYDPAVYYGHREMDLAMTRLFGGFDHAFYEAYNAAFPLEKNYHQRADICNLYPLLVHVKLFGGGYLNDVQQIIKRF